VSFADHFQPYQFSSEQEALMSLQQDMWQVGAELIAHYFDSLAGYGALRDDIPRWKLRCQEAWTIVGMKFDEDIWAEISGFLSDPPPHGLHSDLPGFAQTIEQYEARNRENGRNELLAGNYLVITLYQYWDASWRNRVGDAWKVDVKSVQAEFWGDLRLIRNRLLHDGRADKNMVKRCTRFRWFKAEDEIFITQKMAGEIFTEFFRYSHTTVLEPVIGATPRKGWLARLIGRVSALWPQKKK
jgi:hypothetical protein